MKQLSAVAQCVGEWYETMAPQQHIIPVPFQAVAHDFYVIIITSENHLRKCALVLCSNFQVKRDFWKFPTISSECYLCITVEYLHFIYSKSFHFTICSTLHSAGQCLYISCCCLLLLLLLLLLQVLVCKFQPRFVWQLWDIQDGDSCRVQYLPPSRQLHLRIIMWLITDS